MRKVTTTTTISSVSRPLDALHRKLRDAALAAAHNAYAPYSNFRVGVAIRLANDVIISGNNQENSAYPSGLCAERVTLFYANSKYPNEAVTHLMICAETDEGILKNPITPCGACRQVIIEKENIQKSPIEICLAGLDEMYIIESAAQLMPLAFVPDSLENK